MTGEFVFTDVEQYYGQRKVGDQESTKNDGDLKMKILKILVFVLLGVLLIEGLLYVIIMPCMVPVKVTFRGLQQMQEQQLLQIMQITPKQTWIRFDTARAAAALSSNASIESVIVEKQFPDRVSVSVIERQSVAVSLIEIDGKTVPVQIDKNGVLFSANSGLQDTGIPLVTGLPFDNMSDGHRLNVKYRSLMETIASIRESNAAYFSAVSEIRVVPKEYGSYELILYPVNSRTRVLTDRTLSEESLQYMMVVLDVINSLDPNVSEIDLRYGSVSYRTSSAIQDGGHLE